MEPRKEEPQKIRIELNIVGDGRRFLNFWNWRSGNDVCAEIIDGSLYDEEAEITLEEFINRVIESN
jgi:hypothetical protein